MGLLITVVMPSEYAVDPTGLGRVLELQQMGELKIALANEALAETQSPAVASPTPVVIEPVVKPVAAAPPSMPASSVPTPKPAPTQNSNKMTVTLNRARAQRSNST